MKTKSVSKNGFIEELKNNLTNHINSKDLDPWFFNWFNTFEVLTNKENKEINSYLNKNIPGKWYMVALSGNGTDIGQGIFYEPKFDIYLDLSCYGDEESIDDFNIHEDSIWIFEDESLSAIKKLKKKYENKS